MSSNPEHDELIDNIKRPVRYYRISINGYGGELVYDDATKEEFEYWNSKQAREDCGVDEDSNALSEFLWSYDDDPEKFKKVPEPFRREGNWWAQDGIMHVQGAETGSATITIEELEADSLQSNVIKTIAEYNSFYDFIDENEIDVEVSDLETDSNYMFFGMSVEKGLFFEGLLETQGPIVLSKLKFLTLECHNGDEIITDVHYDEDSVESWEQDTNGKDMIVEIVEV